MKAPWKDYKGNEIHEGDTIIHPSGENGKVVCHDEREEPTDKWNVVYKDGSESRLVLQICEKGMGISVEGGNRRAGLKVKWEEIEQEGHDGYLYRTKVPGGWLVKYTTDVLTTDEKAGLCLHQGYEWRSSVCFVPDVDHLWLA